MTRRVKTARVNGSLGGKQGSRLLSDEQREERARLAGNSTLFRYGKDFYSFLGSKQRQQQKPKTIKPPIAEISKASRRLGMLAFNKLRNI